MFRGKDSIIILFFKFLKEYMWIIYYFKFFVGEIWKNIIFFFLNYFEFVLYKLLILILLRYFNMGKYDDGDFKSIKFYFNNILYV